MKKIILFSAILLATLGLHAQKNFQLEGNIKDLKEGKVSLSIYHSEGDPAVLHANLTKGKFTFKGDVKVPTLAKLIVNDARSGIFFYIEDANISIKIDSAKINKAEIKGSKSNEQYVAFTANCNTKSPQEQIDCFKELANQNPTSIFSPFIVQSKLIYHLDYEELNSLVNKFSSDALNTYDYKNLKTFRDRLEKVSVGKKAPMIIQPDTEGNLKSFEELLKTNQYILIDFWASWCGPCRRKNPHVVEAYKGYHSKGFDIFAVSFDTDKAKWIKAIADDNLTWTHVSELGGFKNSASEAYCINSIPSNVLVDKNGIIVARNLKGDDLKNKLKELLDK